MLFKNFDVDYDKVTIDSNVINRPSYISPMQWSEFWAMHTDLGSDTLEDRIERECEAAILDWETTVSKSIDREKDEAERVILDILTENEISQDIIGPILKELGYIGKSSFH